MIPPEAPYFKEKLLQALKAKGLKQKELGRLAGLNEKTTTRLLTSEDNPGLGTLYKISKVLELSLDELVHRPKKVASLPFNSTIFLEALNKLQHQLTEEQFSELSLGVFNEMLSTTYSYFLTQGIEETDIIKERFIAMVIRNHLVENPKRNR